MHNKSFTLIEVLVVIVVIGILSAFILVGINSITESANIAKSKVFSDSLRNSLLTNLVSEWKLDGNTNDSWGTNNGTWYGAGGGSNLTANWKPESECISGQCLHFDGTDDYVLIPNNDSLNPLGITMDAWVNFNILGEWQTILGKSNTSSTGSGYMIRGTASNEFQVVIYDSLGNIHAASFGSVLQGKWYHVVSFHDGSVVKNYLNGQYMNQINCSGLTSGTRNLFIGRYAASATGYLSGLVDGVRVYSTHGVILSRVGENYYSGINNLYKNKKLIKLEYTQRLSELKDNLTQTNQ